MSQTRVYLTYCIENKEVANRIAEDLGRVGIDFQHDTRSLHAREYSEAQMNSDNAPIFLLISDNFLKSQDCMDGALKFIDNFRLRPRIKPIVIDGQYEKNGETEYVPTKFDKVSNVIRYMNFWQDEYLRLRREKRNLPAGQAQELQGKIDKIRRISNEIGEFLRSLRGFNYASIEDWQASNYQQFFTTLGYEGSRLYSEYSSLPAYVPQVRVDVAEFKQPIEEPIIETPSIEPELADIKQPEVSIPEIPEVEEPVIDSRGIDEPKIQHGDFFSSPRNTDEPVADMMMSDISDISDIPGMDLLSKVVPKPVEEEKSDFFVETPITNPIIEENVEEDVSEELMEEVGKMVEDVENVPLASHGIEITVESSEEEESEEVEETKEETTVESSEEEESEEEEETKEETTAESEEVEEESEEVEEESEEVEEESEEVEEESEEVEETEEETTAEDSEEEESEEVEETEEDEEEEEVEAENTGDNAPSKEEGSFTEPETVVGNVAEKEVPIEILIDDIAQNLVEELDEVASEEGDNDDDKEENEDPAEEEIEEVATANSEEESEEEEDDDNDDDDEEAEGEEVEDEESQEEKLFATAAQLTKDENYGEAKVAYESLLGLQRDNHRARYKYAALLQDKLGMSAEAKPHFEELMLQDKATEKVYFRLGKIAEDNGDYLVAKNYYEKAVSTNRKYAKGYAHLGAIMANHFENQNFVAKSYLKEAIRLAPKNTDARIKLATFYTESEENPKLAAKELKQVVELDEEHTGAFMMLADLYLDKLGKKKKARRYYLEAAEIDEAIVSETLDARFKVKRKVEEPAEEEVLAAQPTVVEAKTVMVTGGTSGIGKAIAERFAANGYRVIITGRREERLAATRQDFKDRFNADVEVLPFDIRNQQATDEAFSSLSEEWKGIDLLINNAGLAKGFSPIHEGSLTHWEQMIDTNIKGLLYISRLVAPGMVERQKGHIINISSIAGHDVYPNGNVYSATKAAVNALSKGMRLDLHKHNIRVTNISPGHVETEFAVVRFDGDEERAKIYEDFQPLTADDIADTIFFAATRPPHVNIENIVLWATQQASATIVDRSGRKTDGE